MKTLSFWKKSVYSALIFFGTLIILSVWYSAWNSPLAMSTVGSGSGLTANGWNALVNNIADLDSRWSRVGSDIAFTGGNVGIGTASPGYKLDVNGTVNASAFRGNGASLTTINPSNISAGTAGINITGSAGSATNANNVPWSGVSGKPTTVSWYGITDISAWAKAGTKPSYGFSEISGTVTDAQVPDNITINTNSLTIGGWIITEKWGNNGTVSCDTFCQWSQWAGWVGTCVAAINGPTGVGVPCSTITNVSLLRCLCAKF